MILHPSQISTLVEIKQNDTARLLYDNLSVSGTPLDLTSGSVLLIWHNQSTGETTTVSASVLVAISGSVSYTLTAADVSEPGSYLLEWEAHLSSSKVISVPTDQYIKLNILPDLDS